MLLVDGSNVPSPLRPWHVPSCGVLRRLVADIARLTRDWECCADVIFGGYPRSGLRQGELVAAVRVWFSEWQSASHCVTSHSHGHARGTLFVVTSDRRLQLRVRRLGAHVVSSEALRRALDIVCSAAHTGAPHSSVLTLRPQALLALEA
jgi:predicted RNA-binding protein with PIN domain